MKVVGFRKWYLAPARQEGFLWPLIGYGSAAWDVGTNSAHCWKLRKNDPHCVEPPEEDCLCGLHAVYSPSQRILSMSMGRWPVGGAVAAWGKIIVGPDGFRAQHAEVIALSASRRFVTQQHHELRDEYWGELGRVAERYGVPIVPFEQLEAAARLVGPLARDV